MNYAVGPNDINHQMLKRIPAEVLNTLVNIPNLVGVSHNGPDSIPGKDTPDHKNYPIHLISCVCKIMESTVNNKRAWYLERNKKNICTTLFSQSLKYHRPACSLGVFCQRGLYSQAACHCYFL